MTLLPGFNGGLNLPQVHYKGLGGAPTSKVSFTDDVVFAPHKRGLLQLMVLIDDVSKISSCLADLLMLDWPQCGSGGGDDRSNGIVTEATSVLGNTSANKAPPNETEELIDRYSVMYLVRLASSSEFTNSPYCVGGPALRYFDEHRLQRELGEGRFVLVRPDRFGSPPAAISRSSAGPWIRFPVR